MSRLTQRETEIIKLVLEEATTNQIAQRLEISKRTVDTHRRNIWKKSETKNLLGLYRFALQNNIIAK
jgi:DNA-binding CsgD family transcriptional regulator